MFRTIQPKLLLLSALPFLLALYFIITAILDSFKTVQDMDLHIIGSQLSVKSSALIHELQKERGITSLFLGSDGRTFSTELSDQYKQTDLRIEELEQYIELVSADYDFDDFSEALKIAASQWELIKAHRSQVNSQLLTDTGGIEFYTQLNSRVLEVIDLITKSSNTSALGTEGFAYINFLRGKEYAGLERAILGRVLLNDGFEMGGFRQFSAVVNAQQSYFEIFRSIADLDHIALFDQVMTNPDIDEALRIRQLAFDSGEISVLDLGIDPIQWFDSMTEKIDLMHEVELRIATDITTQVRLKDLKFADLHRSSVSISALVHEIQKERGYTAAHLASQGEIFKTELSDQRLLVDTKKYELQDSFNSIKGLDLSQNLIDVIVSAELKLEEIEGVRSRINARSIANLDTIQFYTDVNFMLLNIIRGISENAPDIESRSLYFGYISFMRGKERAGIERAVLSRAFAADQLQEGVLQWLGTLVGSQESYFDSFRSNASAEHVAFFDKQMSNPVINVAQGMRELVFERGVLKTLISAVDPAVWYKVMTTKIDGMKEVEDQLSMHYEEGASELQTNAWIVLRLLTTTVLLIIVGIAISIILITRSIRKPIAALIHGAEIIGEGDLKYRVKVEAQDEFARLGDAFNLMATKREIAEKEITEVEQRYADLINRSPDLVWRMTPEGVFTFLSPSIKHMSGYEPEELVGLSIEQSLNEESGRRILDILEGLVRGDVGSDTNKSNTYELTYLRKDGTEYIGEVRLEPILGTDGQVIAIQGIARDVTDKKLADKKNAELQVQVQQFQKIEAIGTLAGGIAHDFNNMLAGVYGYAELAQQQVPKGNPARDSLNEIIKAADRGKNLTQQILTFSRKSEQNKVAADLLSIVRTTLKFMRPILPTTIEIREKINVESAWIFADPTQMQQVLMNLSTNSAGAMHEKGGVLEVFLDEMWVEENSTESSTMGLSPGTYFKLTVRDTGSGISSSEIDRIFDPFFTTKEVGEGTGLGLSIVHAIVTDHNGKITVKSLPDKWTSFTILLPRIDAPSTEQETETELSPGGSERILLVDDEELITEVYKRLLEALGYDVVATNSSVDAFELFRAQPHAYDLVITDQTMPVMTGDELSKKILEIRPDIQIILCTGHSEKIDEVGAQAQGIHSYLMKPVSISTLGKTIRSIFA